jgi:hypothetical protein
MLDELCVTNPMYPYLPIDRRLPQMYIAIVSYFSVKARHLIVDVSLNGVGGCVREIGFGRRVLIVCVQVAIIGSVSYSL